MTTTPAATAPALDLGLLERRRRLALRAAVGSLVTAVTAFPLGMAIGNEPASDTMETIAGACLMAAIRSIT